MKQGTILSAIFLLAFGLTVGIMIGQAEAKPPPCAQCHYDDDIYCSMEPEPGCPPMFPYAWIEYGSCSPGGYFNWSCDIFRGCCLDDNHVLPIIEPEPH